MIGVVRAGRVRRSSGASFAERRGDVTVIALPKGGLGKFDHLNWSGLKLASLSL